jgi:hypothetical protein
MVAGSPGDFAVADLNGDGKTDVAVLDISTNSVDVLFYRGKNSFYPPAEIPAGQYPVQVLAASLHKAGPGPDLVVVNESDSSVSVFLNAGYGTFHGSGIVVGTYPTAATVADMDGDGHLDILVYDGAQEAIYWLKNRGDGTFVDPVALVMGVYSLGGVVATDLDGDGKPDIVVADYCGVVTVYPNDGKGLLGQPYTLSLSQQPEQLIAADLNGDGRTDLAVVMQSSDGNGNGSVGVFLNGAGGKLAKEVTYPVGSYPTSIAAGDLTQDGKPELLVAEGDESVRVLLNGGDGTFTTLTSLPVAASDGSPPTAVKVVDMDGDGLPDIVATTCCSATVQVLYGVCMK